MYPTILELLLYVLYLKSCLFLLVSVGVIDVLVNNGRHIDAVNLAFSFELTEQFCPVTLLKSYLAEAMKVSSSIKAGNSSPSAQVFPLFYIVPKPVLSSLKVAIRAGWVMGQTSWVEKGQSG